MKHQLLLIIVLALLQGCDNQKPTQAGTAMGETEYVSVQKNGKWTTDIASAQDLKSLHYTIENFTLLNKRKFENLLAYQEFGSLLKQQTEQITEKCALDPTAKNMLCSELNKIKTEADVLQGEDITEARLSLVRINTIMAQIDSLFNYQN
jgi:hypothetical protein